MLSNWVVFVDPKVDLDFFSEKEANSDLLIIHYSDQYTSNASEQTIILSTDSEIDQKYYELLKPHIGDEFTLVYDDELMKTTIKKGYLFEGK